MADSSVTCTNQSHPTHTVLDAIQAAPHLTETCHLADIKAKPMRTDKNKNEKKKMK